MIIDVFVERYEEDEADECEFVIDPDDRFYDQYPLQMASTLVDLNRNPTCQLRVLNPSDTVVALKQDAVIAQAERVERILSVVSPAENAGKQRDRSNIRRIQVEQQSTDSKTMEFQEASESEVPEHLIPLYKKAIEGKSTWGKRVIAGTLLKFSDNF
ncbi:hypothetical protein DPMN_152112 [Dreissena polymorpha]|uniref:Uncharacterized protein n=1 Tax=Dreissena polymorpha TaxID=45954 RepID=A0A9D4FMF9_DREPO|nr:hypothetical protein DPMN_152112 [Dreissena polymorpha]